MYGIIKASNTLDIVKIIAKKSGGALTWTVNKFVQDSSNDNNEEPCEQLKFLINENIGFPKSLPFLKVDPNKFEEFDHLSKCNDGGNIYDSNIHDLIKCDKIVCINNMNPDKSIEQQAIIQCGIKYYLEKVYYHSKENKWCKSQYPNHDKIESQSLMDSLIEQGSDEQKANQILNSYHPQVRAYPYFGDIKKQIYNNPEWKQFQEKGLLNKPFDQLQGELKNVYSSIRKCKFVDADPKKNCQNKKGLLHVFVFFEINLSMLLFVSVVQVTPWDIYQNMIDLGFVKSAKSAPAKIENENTINTPNKDESTKKAAEKKTGQEKEPGKDEDENNDKNSVTTNSKLIQNGIIVMIMTLITGSLSFYILHTH